ncbi:MAG TPA: hypothetical protein VMB82_08025 [Acidimicrobiales bacterium]|nr:hypothetical protein [Acidimicrobiales bacterium]
MRSSEATRVTPTTIVTSTVTRRFPNSTIGWNETWAVKRVP